MIRLVVWNIFPCLGNNNPNWLIFFRWVETTNQWFQLVILKLWSLKQKPYPQVGNILVQIRAGAPCPDWGIIGKMMGFTSKNSFTVYPPNPKSLESGVYFTYLCLDPSWRNKPGWSSKYKRWWFLEPKCRFHWKHTGFPESGCMERGRDIPRQLFDWDSTGKSTPGFGWFSVLELPCLNYPI